MTEWNVRYYDSYRDYGTIYGPFEDRQTALLHSALYTYTSTDDEDQDVEYIIAWIQPA